MPNHESEPNTEANKITQVYLPAEGFVRINQILAPKGPIPIGRSTWWAGVKSGRFPKPKRIFGDRITVWAVEDIRSLIATAFSDESTN